MVTEWDTESGGFEDNCKGVETRILRSEEDKVLRGQDDGFPSHSVKNAESLGRSTKSTFCALAHRHTPCP